MTPRALRRKRANDLLWLPVAALVALAPAAAHATRDPGCGTIALPVRSNAVVYRLGKTFLREGSDSLWTRNGTLVRNRDYVLDRVRGELRLLAATGADTMWIAACWMLSPPPVDMQINAYRPISEDEADTTRASASVTARRPATARSPDEAPRGTSLEITGNKTIAVDFGASQDAFLRQSLDLAVSGTLAPGVRITGVLSDRQTPLSTVGATQDIQALDRVLLELTAPRGSATLGDLSIQVNEGEFARLQRRLQGVRGEFHSDAVSVNATAASAAGEYHRMQFFGSEGRQGPYLLTDRDGNSGVSIVAESEVVVLDGERMTRGESADYAIDYERAQITFSNRRPITFASRITVEYQYTVNRYRRNLVTGGGRWTNGNLTAFTQVISEGDDGGRPLDFTLDAADLAVLRNAGDSLASAVGAGVRAGGGDYDSVRVGSELVYAYAGAGAGEFSVTFARVGAGQGAYSDSTLIAGREVFGYVGPGKGTHSIGRGLPLPESRQLWSGGVGVRTGPLALSVEGALSNRDRNTFSARDDGDNVGHAGSARLALAGAVPGGTAGLELEGRRVGERFSPFARLEQPFAQEDWGLPIDTDIDRQDRVVLRGHVAPKVGGELRGHLGRLETPSGFSSLRRGLEWVAGGRVATRALWERADGEQAGVAFPDGGRERALGEVRWRLPWVEPTLRATSDERRAPSDTGLVGDRYREAAFELRSAGALRWRAAAGLALRRDATRTAEGFDDRADTRTLQGSLESPRDRSVNAAIHYQMREVHPISGLQRTRSDLASVRLRADDRARGLRALVNLEVTSEGENRRARTLVFVGPNQGAYDAFGNFVGTGDYDLVLSVSPDLDRLSRTVTGTQLAWTLGGAGAWSGSRVSFDFESEARRRGEFRVADAAVSPGAVLADAGLARGRLLQRVETDLMPASPAAALRVRVERRVSADRSFLNFAQTMDERLASGRWRARPGSALSTEVEVRMQEQNAGQAVAGGPSLDRTMLTRGGTGQIIFTPGSGLRAVAALEALWSKPRGAEAFTQTVRLGPDLGLSVGARGRLEMTVRRGFVSGPPPSVLLPTADPAGPPRWDGTARFDYRVRQSVTFGASLTYVDRTGRRAQTTGRTELRAFF